MEYSEMNQPAQKAAVLESLFVVFVLFLSTGAVIPLLRHEYGVGFDPVKGDIVMQGLWFGIYTIAFMLLFTRLRHFTHVVCQDKFLWLLVGLAFVSFVWSSSPPVTFRRCMALLGSSAFGIYLATRFTWQEILKLLAWALGLSAVLSLGFVLLLPSSGIHHDIYHDGAWRGIYVHKNVLGRFMAFSAITWLLYTFTSSRGRIVGFVFFSISIEMLFLSRSKTSLLVFILLLFILMIYLYRLGRWRYILPVVVTILVIGSTTFLLINIPATTLGHGNEKIITPGFPEVDLTLTGRTVLWHAVWDMIQWRPLLGYGYSAFWLGFEGPSSHIWRVLPWRPPNAHNGYLDLWLQLGLVGLVIFIISFIVLLFKTLVLARSKKGPFETFSLVFLIIIAINNISESFILVQNCIFWILYVVISTTINAEYQKNDIVRKYLFI